MEGVWKRAWSPAFQTLNMHAFFETAATIEKKLIELGLNCLAACGKYTCAVITDTDTDTDADASQPDQDLSSKGTTGALLESLSLTRPGRSCSMVAATGTHHPGEPVLRFIRDPMLPVPA